MKKRSGGVRRQWGKSKARWNLKGEGEGGDRFSSPSKWSHPFSHGLKHHPQDNNSQTYISRLNLPSELSPPAASWASLLTHGRTSHVSKQKSWLGPSPPPISLSRLSDGTTWYRGVSLDCSFPPHDHSNCTSWHLKMHFESVHILLDPLPSP